MFEPSKKLSPHFTLAEMCITKSGLKNHASAEEQVALTFLCDRVLEPIRAKWGPVFVHSGYRNEGVNSECGGARTSQHLLGEAADFHCPNAALDLVFEWIVVLSGLDYDQCIREPSWIHISFTRRDKNRRQPLVKTPDGYEPAIFGRKE